MAWGERGVGVRPYTKDEYQVVWWWEAARGRDSCDGLLPPAASSCLVGVQYNARVTRDHGLWMTG
jgi:hypothetical protein